ncbi:Carbohydrate esterase 4 protein [Ceratobasidium sp. 392]|nr:Carbohydrate esterase 4 protein [Ceratobasidium sp. 392]
MLSTTSLLILGALLVSATHGHANPALGTRKHPTPQVYTACTKPKVAAITYDDGPNLYTKTIVDTFNEAGGKVTFFFNGDNYHCIYDADEVDRAKYALSHGHQVAGHTWAHLHLPTLNDTAIKSEFTRTNDAMKKILGIVPSLVRPPFGEYNSNVSTIAASLGQSLVTWDFDSQDWTGAASADIEAAYKTRFDTNPKNILPLNHEVYILLKSPDTSVHDVLPYVIGLAKSKGYKLVTVAECLGIPPYLYKSKPSKRDASALTFTALLGDTNQDLKGFVDLLESLIVLANGGGLKVTGLINKDSTGCKIYLRRAASIDHLSNPFCLPDIPSDSIHV